MNSEAIGSAAHWAARGRQLEWLTIAWNCAECFIAVVAGWLAGSIALVGFGIDSAIEVASAVALLWRLQHAGAARDQKALRIVGVCFLALAAYVATDAGLMLVRRQAPEESLTGIVLSLLSLAVMPVLARAKRRVAGQLNSAAMEADARQTDLCAWLSAILLAGLLLNALLGWWWADPAAALAMTPIIAREGLDALRGKTCANCSACH